MTSWHTAKGIPTGIVSIIQTAKRHIGKNGKVYLGTDSFITKTSCVFASTICLHGAEGMQGGIYFFKKEIFKKRNFSSLRQRIFQEVQTTINLATYLYENEIDNLELHLDISPSHKSTKTSSMADMLTGYVKGVGFECKIKPEAWAAASVADKHSK